MISSSNQNNHPPAAAATNHQRPHLSSSSFCDHHHHSAVDYALWLEWSSRHRYRGDDDRNNNNNNNNLLDTYVDPVIVDHMTILQKNNKNISTPHCNDDDDVLLQQKQKQKQLYTDSTTKDTSSKSEVVGVDNNCHDEDQAGRRFRSSRNRNITNNNKRHRRDENNNNDCYALSSLVAYYPTPRDIERASVLDGCVVAKTSPSLVLLENGWSLSDSNKNKNDKTTTAGKDATRSKKTTPDYDDEGLLQWPGVEEIEEIMSNSASLRSSTSSLWMKLSPKMKPQQQPQQPHSTNNSEQQQQRRHVETTQERMDNHPTTTTFRRPPTTTPDASPSSTTNKSSPSSSSQSPPMTQDPMRISTSTILGEQNEIWQQIQLQRQEHIDYQQWGRNGTYNRASNKVDDVGGSSSSTLHPRSSRRNSGNNDKVDGNGGSTHHTSTHRRVQHHLHPRPTDNAQPLSASALTDKDDDDDNGNGSSTHHTSTRRRIHPHPHPRPADNVLPPSAPAHTVNTAAVVETTRPPPAKLPEFRCRPHRKTKGIQTNHASSTTTEKDRSTLSISESTVSPSSSFPRNRQTDASATGAIAPSRRNRRRHAITVQCLTCHAPLKINATRQVPTKVVYCAGCGTMASADLMRTMID